MACRCLGFLLFALAIKTPALVASGLREVGGPPDRGVVNNHRYLYQRDGFGRLIRKHQPWTRNLCPGATPVSEGVTALQKKEFYYDGVRRIQEVILRPDLLMENLESGSFLTDGDAANDEGPVELLTPGGLDPGQEIVGDEPMAAAIHGPPPPPINHWTDREYIYGPDYMDEFIGQIVPQTPYTGTSGGPPAGSAYYMLQDANYNVVALLSSQGHVLEQYGYEPYGSLAAIDKFAGLRPVNRVGHQGLFFERFDGTYTDATLDIAPWGVTYGPIGTGLYFARNRFYAPALGRWTSKDPNETAAPILTAIAMNGEGLGTALGSTQIKLHYADGMNTYQYLGSNTFSATDPMGLSMLALLADAFADAEARAQANRIAGLGITYGFLLYRLVDTLEELRLAIAADAALESAGMCEFFRAWCRWGNGRPPGDRGKGWKRNAPCEECFRDCKALGIWPFLKCPIPGGKKWPGPKDDFEPVWPTSGEY